MRNDKSHVLCNFHGAVEKFRQMINISPPGKFAYCINLLGNFIQILGHIFFDYDILKVMRIEFQAMPY